MTYNLTLLDCLEERWTSNLLPNRASELQREYEEVKGKSRQEAPEFKGLREFMTKIIHEALLDYSQAWPLVNFALEAMINPDLQGTNDVIAELELLEYLSQWRTRFENSQRLERRLAEVRRITEQMEADCGLLNVYRDNITGLAHQSKTQLQAIERNGRRIMNDLTRLAQSLNKDLRGKRHS
jgi:hypothetical protein